MFEERSLPEDVAEVRATHAPDALVLDAASDFETLDPERAENLGLVAASLDPATYPAEWLPEDAPQLLRRYASADFTVGMPGDGSVAWTRQTEPPTVIVKPRVEGSPDDFVDFLVAEALVEIGTGLPEQFLGFFEDRYRDLDAALPLGPSGVYQIAAALYDAYLGLHTRDVFTEWADEQPRLFDAWQDAGERIEPRLAELPKSMARDETEFAEAAEFACAAVKHGLELPAPFAALDTEAYRDHGADYAVKWAEKTFA
ncbi:DUF7089 family protein [Halorussus litoreus]|uniref:DUF7089 family protein n=1 Tax=Halorussus litoreus TaxID=1710536 RepID=UPI000E2509CD|nr:hypothetical protein [Halorussus litoreus]